MSDSCRRSLLFALSLVAMMMFAAAAFAECNTECSLAFSLCSQDCDVCTHQGIDGCDAWRSSTCGDEYGACIQDNCTPNWVETARTNVGTYDGNSWNSCTHHSVDSVTLTDYNQCNRSSYYYTYTYCDDHIDGHKYSGFYPSCCNGYNADYPYQALTCNGYHSCS